MTIIALFRKLPESTKVTIDEKLNK